MEWHAVHYSLNYDGCIANIGNLLVQVAIGKLAHVSLRVCSKPTHLQGVQGPSTEPHPW